MGCGNSKTEGHGHLSVYNPNKHYHHKRDGKSAGNFEMKNTAEIEAIQKQEIKTEEKNFLKLAEEAKSLNEIKWEKLILDNQTYFDLLNAMGENNDLTSFTMDSVQIEGGSDKMISLARALMPKSQLKKLEFISMANLGHKKAKSIAKIMENCKLVDRLVLKDLDFTEEDAKYIGVILSELSNNLIYFELSLAFFRSRQHDFIKGLSHNNSIQELILNKINLIEEDFKLLIQAVSTNFCLTKLDVSNNPVKMGVSAFKEHTLLNLKHLNMDNCDIDDGCFLNLLEGIKNSLTLIYLNLNNNYITEESKEQVKFFFEGNRVLEYFYILNNKLCKRDLAPKLNDEDLLKVVSEI